MKKKCTWKKYYESTTFRADAMNVQVIYDTDCNFKYNYIPNGIPKEHFVFCPICGREINEVLK